MAESKQERALEDRLLGVKGPKGKAWKAAGTGATDSARAAGARARGESLEKEPIFAPKGKQAIMHKLPKGGAC